MKEQWANDQRIHSLRKAIERRNQSGKAIDLGALSRRVEPRPDLEYGGSSEGGARVFPRHSSVPELGVDGSGEQRERREEARQKIS